MKTLRWGTHLPARLRALLGAALLLALLAPAPAGACPLCKNTVRDDSSGLAAGFNLSTVVMLGGLFGMVGWVVFLFAGAARSGSRPPAETGAARQVSGAGAPAPPEPSSAPPARSR